MASVISLPAKPRPKDSGSGGGLPCTRRALIYFICGNPGLVGFYAVFLDCLRAMLDAEDASTTTAYDIYGRNLLGFADDDHAPFGSEGGKAEPWDLEGQIEGIYKDVAARRVSAGDGENDDRPYDFVILMGHSVGAYIAVEIFHQHTTQQQQHPSPRAPHLTLRHGMLLFPTLTHIALSPRGRPAAAALAVVPPALAAYARALAGLALAVFSPGALRWLMERAWGFTPQTAEVAARWLKSRDGVWQALHLGAAELRTICEERWGEELWEVKTAERSDKETQRQKTPKFFVFYGKNDGWVADRFRDAFIEKRREHGERRGGTRIEVDDGDIPHAFCVQEHTSWVIAKKVFEWVGEIEEGLK